MSLMEIQWLLHLNYWNSCLEKEKHEGKEQLPSMNQDFWMTPSGTSTPLSLQKCGVTRRWTWERTELNVSVGAWKENIQINTMILLTEQLQHNYSYIKTVTVRHQQCHHNAYIKRWLIRAPKFKWNTYCHLKRFRKWKPIYAA